MSNENLDVIVSSIYTEFPNCGIRRMKGFLLARGIRIQWERVRASLWRVDPEGILLRSMQLNLVRRRHYSVPGPLSLWHLDGNHKIIRWGFVIHGCVDGYSQRVRFLGQVQTTRQILYLHCLQRLLKNLGFLIVLEEIKALKTLM